MSSRALIVAGVMAGFACGVKYTAVPFVAGALGVAIFGVAILSREFGTRWKGILLFGTVAIVVASPWLIRNVAWTGNPVFPLAMRTLGRGHFDELQVARFERAHSPTEQDRPIGARLARLRGEVVSNWQYGYVIWGLSLAALALAWRRREARVIGVFLLTGLIVWVGFTHLLGRFFVFAIPVAALSVGLVRWRVWVAVSSGGALLGVIIVWTHLHDRIVMFDSIASNGLYGLDDLSYFTPPELADVPKGVRISLIGDAEGFLYRYVPGEFHYRTVFDLPGGAADMYEAWLGVPESAARGALVINPMEVERLSRTYLGVPGLPPDFAGPRDRAFVVRR